MGAVVKTVSRPVGGGVAFEGPLTNLSEMVGRSWMMMIESMLVSKTSF